MLYTILIKCFGLKYNKKVNIKRSNYYLKKHFTLTLNLAAKTTNQTKKIKFGANAIYEHNNQTCINVRNCVASMISCPYVSNIVYFPFLGITTLKSAIKTQSFAKKLPYIVI